MNKTEQFEKEYAEAGFKVCNYCNTTVDEVNGLDICQDCIFQMEFEGRTDELKKIAVKSLDELKLMLNDHIELKKDINVDSIVLIESCHRHLQNLKQVVEAL